MKFVRAVNSEGADARRLQGSIAPSLLGPHGFFPPILAHFTLYINQISLEYFNNNNNIRIHG